MTFRSGARIRLAVKILIAVWLVAAVCFASIVFSIRSDLPLAEPIFQNPAQETLMQKADSALSYDTSTASEGYITLHVMAEGYACQIFADGKDFTYLNLPRGEHALPLSMGDGHYRIRLARRLQGDQFTVLKDLTDVPVDTDDRAFLRPSYVVDYEKTDALVQMARALSAGAKRLEAAENICSWNHDHISYDMAKKDWVTKHNGFADNVPDPEQTFTERRGVCVDQAALTTAMLRAAGVPARMAFGYWGNQYHAWAVAKVTSSKWVIVDSTNDFVGHSKEYIPEKYY